MDLMRAKVAPEIHPLDGCPLREAPVRGKLAEIHAGMPEGLK